ncbi:MAG: hypothetical protein RIE52_08845 [Balneola sp.]|jgi:hypothetical protein
MKKEDIDRLIEESLNKDEAKFYHELEEEGLFKQWGGLYTGKLKGWAILTTVIQLIFTVATFYLGYQFFTATETVDLFKLGGTFFIIFFAASMMKLWHWMQMDKNSILREMKRMEFQIAVLSEKVSDKRD